MTENGAPLTRRELRERMAAQAAASAQEPVNTAPDVQSGAAALRHGHHAGQGPVDADSPVVHHDAPSHAVQEAQEDAALRRARRRGGDAPSGTLYLPRAGAVAPGRQDDAADSAPEAASAPPVEAQPAAVGPTVLEPAPTEPAPAQPSAVEPAVREPAAAAPTAPAPVAPGESARPTNATQVEKPAAAVEQEAAPRAPAPKRQHSEPRRSRRIERLKRQAAEAADLSSPAADVSATPAAPAPVAPARGTLPPAGPVNSSGSAAKAPGDQPRTGPEASEDRFLSSPRPAAPAEPSAPVPPPSRTPAPNRPEGTASVPTPGTEASPRAAAQPVVPAPASNAAAAPAAAQGGPGSSDSAQRAEAPRAGAASTQRHTGHRERASRRPAADARVDQLRAALSGSALTDASAETLDELTAERDRQVRDAISRRASGSAPSRSFSDVLGLPEDASAAPARQHGSRRHPTAPSARAATPAPAPVAEDPEARKRLENTGLIAPVTQEISVVLPSAPATAAITRVPEPEEATEAEPLQAAQAHGLDPLEYRAAGVRRTRVGLAVVISSVIVAIAAIVVALAL